MCSIILLFKTSRGKAGVRFADPTSNLMYSDPCFQCKRGQGAAPISHPTAQQFDMAGTPTAVYLHTSTNFQGKRDRSCVGNETLPRWTFKSKSVGQVSPALSNITRVETIDAGTSTAVLNIVHHVHEVPGSTLTCYKHNTARTKCKQAVSLKRITVIISNSRSIHRKA